jgi:hypothetical protein
MWRTLKHKFLLPFLGIYEFESETISRFFLVSPYMKNGTLAQWRKKLEGNPLVAEIAERVRVRFLWVLVHTHLQGR